jgi:hypothetical protein
MESPCPGELICACAMLAIPKKATPRRDCAVLLFNMRPRFMTSSFYQISNIAEVKDYASLASPYCATSHNQLI